MAILRDPRIKDVRFAGGALEVVLHDGRKISVPQSWFPRVQSASLGEQVVWVISADGLSVCWPAIGEELRVADLLRGD